MARVLMTGITGEDEQHLAELLHDQGYDVFGMVKGQSNPEATAVVAAMPFVELTQGEFADPRLPRRGAGDDSALTRFTTSGATSFVAEDLRG